MGNPEYDAMVMEAILARKDNDEEIDAFIYEQIEKEESIKEAPKEEIIKEAPKKVRKSRAKKVKAIDAPKETIKEEKAIETPKEVLEAASGRPTKESMTLEIEGDRKYTTFLPLQSFSGKTEIAANKENWTSCENADNDRTFEVPNLTAGDIIEIKTIEDSKGKIVVVIKYFMFETIVGNRLYYETCFSRSDAIDKGHQRKLMNKDTIIEVVKEAPKFEGTMTAIKEAPIEIVKEVPIEIVKEAPKKTKKQQKWDAQKEDKKTKKEIMKELNLSKNKFNSLNLKATGKSGHSLLYSFKEAKNKVGRIKNRKEKKAAIVKDKKKKIQKVLEKYKKKLKEIRDRYKAKRIRIQGQLTEVLKKYRGK